MKKKPEEALRRALEYLTQEKVLRRQVDADTKKEVYQLDHDSLCGGVLEAERRARRWQVEAEDARRRFEKASGWWAKWQALLSPSRQILLVWKGMWGQFVYADLRRFACLSLLRFVPLLLVAVVLVLGGSQWRTWRQDQEDRETARAFLARIGNTDHLTAEEVPIYWEFAGCGENVRLHLLKEAMKPGNAERFNRRQDVALQAAVQLDSDLRRRVLEEVVLRELSKPPTDPHVLIALFAVAQELNIAKDADFAPKLAQQGADAFLAALPTISADQLPAVAENITALAGLMADEKVTKLAELILAEMKNRSSNPDATFTLAVPLAELAGRMVDKEAARRMAAQAADQILARLRWPRSFRRDETSFFKAKLKDFATRVADNDAAEVAKRILEEMHKENIASDTITLLAAPLAALVGRITDKKEGGGKAYEAAVPIYVEMGKQDAAPGTLSTLALPLAELTVQMADKETAGRMTANVAKSILAKMKRNTTSYTIPILADALAALADRMADKKKSGEMIAEAAEWMCAKMWEQDMGGRPTDRKTLSSLALSLAALLDRMADKEDAGNLADSAAMRIYTELQQTKFYKDLALLDLGSSLASLAGRMADKVAAGKMTAQVAEWILTEMREQGATPVTISRLANSLGVLVGRMTNSKEAGKKADKAVKLILGEMERAVNNPSTQIDLASSLAALAGGIPDQEMPGKIITMMDSTKDVKLFQTLAKVLLGLESESARTRLFNLLKHPLCVGESRTILVKLFEKRFAPNGRFAGNVWKLVAWVEKTKPAGLDLKSPPQR